MYRDNLTSKPQDNGASTATKKLLSAITICFLFMTGEVIGGYLSGSVAILTDAAHLLADITGFAISLFSIWLANKGSSPTLSYGFKRAEILGALLSIVVIWVLTGVLVVEAANRTIQILNQSHANKSDPLIFVDGKIMFIVAVIGLCCNLALLKLLGHDHGHSHGGHGHSHGGGHGHAHDGGHGHAHGASEHERSGHAHGDSDHHGHSHGSSRQPAKRDEENQSEVVESTSGHVEKEPLLDPSQKGSGYGSVVVTPLGNESNLPAKSKSSLENINIGAAYAHAIGDLIQSIGVCIAGALIWAMPGDQYPLIQLADPIATFLFSVLVLYSTVMVLRTSIMVLMEAAPEHVDLSSIMEELVNVKGVIDVHDLHIWSVTHGDLALTVHVIIEPDSCTESQVLRRVQHRLRARGIQHSTIQVEVGTLPVCNEDSCDELETSGDCSGYAFECANEKCNDYKVL